MKKLILTITVLGALTLTSVAQNGNKVANTTEQLSPEQKADKETSKATAALGLNDSQKAKFKQFSLDRINANRPLREKAKASTDKTEKQALNTQFKANVEKFFSNVNGILNADQQLKWAEQKKNHEAQAGDKANHLD